MSPYCSTLKGECPQQCAKVSWRVAKRECFSVFPHRVLLSPAKLVLFQASRPGGNSVEARLKPLSRPEPQLAQAFEPRVSTRVRDHAHTLSDFRTPTLSIECRGRKGRYNVAKLIEQYGDMKLPDLRYVLANCPKSRSFSVYDRCQVRYGKDSRLS